MNKFYSKILLIVAGSLLFSNTLAQNHTAELPTKKKRGTVYLMWGYNRETYSKSNIHFKNTTTDNYDFTFQNAEAHDKKNGDMDDFWHTGLTIPQYSCAIGYLFNNRRNWGIEVSWDHLKYIVYDNQVIHVKGQIRGNPIDKDTLVTPDFVHLQHTNGNNYLMLNLVKKSSIFKRPLFELSAISKLGAGPLVSYTMSTILGSEDKGHFRIQGFVIGLSTGIRADILKYFFLQINVQGAYANYLDSEIGADRVGRAKHHFYSLAGMAFFGINVPLDTFAKKPQE